MQRSLTIRMKLLSTFPFFLTPLVFLPAMLFASPLRTADATSNLEAVFLNPPATAKPMVWWHWMGHNISEEGITKDLEAMKSAGIGGATIFNLTSSVKAGGAPFTNTPWPENDYRSPAW